MLYLCIMSIVLVITIGVMYRKMYLTEMRVVEFQDLVLQLLIDRQEIDTSIMAAINMIWAQINPNQHFSPPNGLPDDFDFLGMDAKQENKPKKPLTLEDLLGDNDGGLL